MSCSARGMSLTAAILAAGCLAAGCGSTVSTVRSAMDAERVPDPFGPQDPRQPEVVRERLLTFESSLRALREGDESVA